jgi:hypothetical protein
VSELIALKVHSSARGSSSSSGARLSDGARARVDVDYALDCIALSLSTDVLDRVSLRLERRCA